MNLTTVVLIGTGLSMDALAVAVATGCAMRGLHIRYAVRLAIFFGIFQALMPVIGWAAGLGFRGIIQSCDHWIAFGLLSVIGAKMIYESRLIGDERPNVPDIQKLTVVCGLALATSIDALAVGLSLSLLKVDIVQPALIIGVITFALSLAGFLAGEYIGHLFEKKIEVIGGLILIAIGLGILYQHLVL